MVISPGGGLIDKFYVNTYSNTTIELAQDSTVWIYAKRKPGIIGIDGPRSDVASIGYTDDGPPASVSGLSINATGPFEVTLRWNSNSEEDMGGYQIWRSEDAVQYLQIETVDQTGAAITYVDDTVDEDTTYYYKVFAVDLSGYQSVEASGLATTPLSPTPPPNVFPLEVYPAERAISVLWTAPTSISAEKIDHYLISLVEVDIGGSPDEETRLDYTIPNDRLYWWFADLKNGQQYEVTIYTVDTKNRVSEGIVKRVTPQPRPSAPLDPKNVTYTITPAQFGYTMNLTWEAGDDEYDESTTYRYRIYITPQGSPESLPIDVPLGFSDEQVSLYSYDDQVWNPIVENKTYSVRLTALSNSTGQNESLGYRLRLSIDKESRPSPLQNLQASFSFELGQIDVTWSLASDINDVELKIYRTDLEDAYYTDVLIYEENIGRVSRYTLKPISLNQRYTFQLTPISALGVRGALGSTVAVTLIPSGTPEAPTPPDYITINRQDRALALFWPESTDGRVRYYKLYRKQGDISFTPADWTNIDTLPKEMNGFTDYGLTNDQLYSYYVTCVDVYGTESLHLPDLQVNLNYRSASPVRQGFLTEPYDVELSFMAGQVLVTWSAISEEFDSFSIFRSENNLHSWHLLATVDHFASEYLDEELPLIDGTTYYYTVVKSVNDAEIFAQSTSSPVTTAVCLGKVEVGTGAGEITIDDSCRRNIANMQDPITEWTDLLLLTHHHNEDSSRIQLSANVIIGPADWATEDNKIFTTTEFLIGDEYIVTVDDRIPDIFYTVNPAEQQIVFADSLAEGAKLSVTVIGTSEVEGTLPNTRFDNIHARQIAFGQIMKEQLPQIGHDGRLMERLLPDRFLLQRYSDHIFMVPEGTTDTKESFGDGTAFYTVIESDGLLDELFDYDLLEDGAQLAFQNPSYSDTTVLNLSQTTANDTIAALYDDAVDLDGSTWDNSPLLLTMGSSTGSDGIPTSNDAYVRFQIDLPVGMRISDARIVFTGLDSVGDDCVLSIGIVDPWTMPTDTNLMLPIRSIAVGDEITWIPPIWEAGVCNSTTTTPSLLSLINTYLDSGLYVPGNHIVFKIRSLPITTGNNYRAAYSFAGDPTKAPILQISYVNDRSYVTSNPAGWKSTKCYGFDFQFADGLANRWVRITTERGAIQPNPVIDLKKRLRFRLRLDSGSLYMSLGIREITGSAHTVGSNGGTTGPIEWVGATEMIGDAPIGFKIEGSVGEWQEFDLELNKQAVVAGDGGDGVLSGDYGVWESIAFAVDPNSENPVGPFAVYIDEVQQITDVLVAGTSQGILYSRDFGASWTLSRYTATPVHKFYRAKNNRYLWAISASEVMLATDPDSFFTTKGTFGIQYIKDIAEDSDGNMYISTDKGVYWFDMSMLLVFGSWQQCRPVNPYTTECYGLFYNAGASGLGEMWVSTEVGIYKTQDHGETWVESGMDCASLPAYQFQEIVKSSERQVILAHTRKHILRKTETDANFVVLADLEEQQSLVDLWDMQYFNAQIYISTSKGILFNSSGDVSQSSVTAIEFDRRLPGLAINGFQTIAFGLDVVTDYDDTEQMFVSQENRLMVCNKENKVSTRKRYRNKQSPIFYVGSDMVPIGYIYNTFNKTLCFRDVIDADELVYCSYSPIESYLPANGGWAFTKPLTDVFILVEGLPRWCDFAINQNLFLSDITTQRGKVASVVLNDINSEYPTSAATQTKLLAIIDSILDSGKDDEAGNPVADVSEAKIADYINTYYLFLHETTNAVHEQYGLGDPRVLLYGFDPTARVGETRSSRWEERYSFTAKDATGIVIDAVTGRVDFSTAINNATDPELKAQFIFDKFQNLHVHVFNTHIVHYGDYMHRDIEDRLEEVNTGLSVSLADAAYGNFIKAVLKVEKQFGDIFADNPAVENIQSRFYSIATAPTDWYDPLNSTIGHSLLVSTDTSDEGNYVNFLTVFEDDPYLQNRVWACTNNGIFEYSLIDGDMSPIRRISLSDRHPYVRHVRQTTDESVYAIGWDGDLRSSDLFLSSDLGGSWERQQEFNLPNRVYTIEEINGNLAAATESGLYYQNNSFHTWYPAIVTLPIGRGTDAELAASSTKINHLIKDTFLIAVAGLNFYRSYNGIEYVSAGAVSNISRVNKVVRYKNNTFIASDRGLYADGNSILSDRIALADMKIEPDHDEALLLEVNDIAAGADALYCCTNRGRVYRYYDDGLGQVWTSYKVANLETIHKIYLLESDDYEQLIVVSYNVVRTLNVTKGSGVFG